MLYHSNREITKTLSETGVLKETKTQKTLGLLREQCWYKSGEMATGGGVE